MNALVISKSNCGYCTRVKNLLDIKKVEYIELKYNVNITPEELETKIRKHIGEGVRITFPQVFVDSVYIGGYSDTCEYFGINP